MTLNASVLRKNIYKILDQVLATGVPVEIARHGKRLRIVPVEPSRKLERLPRRQFLKCNPEDLVHQDWSDEWQP